MKPTFMRRVGSAVAIILAVCGGVIACGDDDKDPV